MRLPKTEFYHSWIYEQHLSRPKSFKPDPDRVINANLRKLERKWRKYEKRILSEISKVTKLKWQESHIIIYITSGDLWFSFPMTISVHKNTEILFDTLTHEFIHRIVSEPGNWERIRKNWKKLFSQYRQETLNTKIHIPIHAIHKHLYLKLFGEQRLEAEIKLMAKFPDYKRSWEIVQRDGYENIIRQLTKGLN